MELYLPRAPAAVAPGAPAASASAPSRPRGSTWRPATLAPAVLAAATALARARAPRRQGACRAEAKKSLGTRTFSGFTWIYPAKIWQNGDPTTTESSHESTVKTIPKPVQYFFAGETRWLGWWTGRAWLLWFEQWPKRCGVFSTMVTSKQVWPLGVIYAYAQPILDRSNYGQRKETNAYW